ncbi:MAG: DNA-directed RNA polymerase subunit H [Nanoarchaeota archaeon]|nr:DNA-directed RNA polymerase subunit H [Nanoarchaeota archaeon]MBU4352340.1 DNA-directed RNA polymerase subunit H [Nanoarchaeota archaeon]MBU4455944.1 DNA-directed RNA polymerase subunit H [Nanoarchaeota archaeon]MCG2719549.1 DNA-directed RNA polymerase subunit H [Nanoarchaeota archaeon]
MSEEINITKHIFVPKHTKLTEEEKEKILEEYNISLSQLPKISKNDPAIKELEVKKGDLIKIERKSPTIGKSIFYRVVVGNA